MKLLFTLVTLSLAIPCFADSYEAGMPGTATTTIQKQRMEDPETDRTIEKTSTTTRRGVSKKEVMPVKRVKTTTKTRSDVDRQNMDEEEN